MVEKIVKEKGLNNCKRESLLQKTEKRQEQLPSGEHSECMAFKDNENRYPQRKKQHNKFILMNHFMSSETRFLVKDAIVLHLLML
jgi:hypothetical protein